MYYIIHCYRYEFFFNFAIPSCLTASNQILRKFTAIRLLVLRYVIIRSRSFLRNIYLFFNLYNWKIFHLHDDTELQKHVQYKPGWELHACWMSDSRYLCSFTFSVLILVSNKLNAVWICTFQQTHKYDECTSYVRKKCHVGSMTIQQFMNVSTNFNFTHVSLEKPSCFCSSSYNKHCD